MPIKAGFPPISRDNTALAIIDMQKDFLDEGGACFVPGGRSVVPATRQLLEAFRAADLPVIHVMVRWQKDGTVHLVVAGVCTNFCVRSTVHDAAFRDFLPVVARDCATSYTPEEHEQTL